MAAQFDIVDVCRSARLEHEHHFVLRTIERTHPGIGLGPDADVLQLIIDAVTCHQQLMRMAPVHANEVQGPFCRIGGKTRHDINKEPDKFLAGHFSGGHGKFTVADTAKAGDMSLNRDIIRRIGKDHLRPIFTHQDVIARLLRARSESC